jgi:2-hydroxychromene-2-carboxylate isomerase
VAHTVGLDWQDALQYIENEDWRTLVEQNQSELSQFGLWGVPVFSFDGITVWGQDRLWVIRQRIEQLVRER